MNGTIKSTDTEWDCYTVGLLFRYRMGHRFWLTGWVFSKKKMLRLLFNPCHFVDFVNYRAISKDKTKLPFSFLSCSLVFVDAL